MRSSENDFFRPPGPLLTLVLYPLLLRPCECAFLPLHANLLEGCTLVTSGSQRLPSSEKVLPLCTYRFLAWPPLQSLAVKKKLFFFCVQIFGGESRGRKNHDSHRRDRIRRDFLHWIFRYFLQILGGSSY